MRRPAASGYMRGLSVVVVGMVCSVAGAASEPGDAHSLCLPTGPPPEEGYVRYVGAVEGRGLKVIGGVPAYWWYRGCGPTAAGMVIGYWDGQGLGKLIPGDASSQTTMVDAAIASYGHYVDYSLPKDYWPDPILPDKSEDPPGDEHESNCIADFMRTSWSAADLYWGWSYFSAMDDALVDYVHWVNGTYGAWYESGSWSEPWGDLTWSAFVGEIDAGRPMVFLVDTDGDASSDHFVTAIGYRDVYGYQEYACLDTWDTGGYRWERFRGMSGQYDWGIHGGTYFVAMACVGDITGDGVVDVVDLLEVLGAWGDCYACAADITGDGVVDVLDLLEVLEGWGSCW